ncbi:hypothetical protein [Bradyrhizobium sp. CB3481]|uniref:hypothetical protein n=1 Tax=Bradyrhizobium sp. CB3481 TaxID=3039158 RepID=UPI0024B168AF|nr:hypothetical protein [Bradyrhizobium sp. CB3481]WFU14617.1 hypothetical protein QA643_26405 [Bradyrhizobium sp. CB3481]
MANVQRVFGFRAGMSVTYAPALEVPVTSTRKNLRGVRMNFSSSKDEGLLSLWESVRRQVLADRANGGCCRFVGNNLRTYAELLCLEMDRRELKYTPINWS